METTASTDVPPEVPSEPPATDAVALEHRRITPGRVAATVVVVSMVAMWAYAFSPWAVKDPPDQLDDATFARQAEPVCANALDEIDALPAAVDARSPEARASAVAQATTILTDMVGHLRALAPHDGSRDARITDLWLDDWETHLADRRAYVVALQEGSTRPAQFTARGGRSITVTVDHFADVNDMHSCATPLDI